MPSFATGKFTQDLNLPFDLDRQQENLPLPLSIGRPLATKAPLVNPSMFFYLISSDNRDATMSLSINVVVLLPIATIKLYHESGKERNRLIHFSSLVILISTDNN
jgi:hypothetical protein